MQDLTGKEDATSGANGSLGADQWNQFPTEVQNIITALGQALSALDLNQLGKSIAGYVAHGDFYSDIGSVNSYTLSTIDGKQSPPSYSDGMTVRFICNSTNTGASIINVAGLGSTDLKADGGGDLLAGSLSEISVNSATYNEDSGAFWLCSDSANKSVLDVASLRLQEPTIDGQIYTLRGHTIIGVGGGQFYYDQSDTVTVDDNGLCIVTTSGHRIKRIINNNRISSAIFGALESSVDNTININSALVSGSENSLIVDDSGSRYEIQSPVIVPSNTEWVFGEIVNTHGVDQNQMLCFYVGNYHPAYFSGVGGDSSTYDRYETNAYTRGLNSIELSILSEASNFAAGDVVFIRSESHYLNGSIEQPDTGSLNKVIGVDGAVISFEEPLVDSFSSGWISQANDNGATGILGDPLFACSNSVIKGGKAESVNGNVFERGGAYKTIIEIDRLESRTGIFTNLIDFCNIKINSTNVTRKMFDLAGCSNSNKITLNSTTYRLSAESTNSNLIALNENCVANDISMNSVNANDYNYDNDIVFVAAARRNKLTINNLVTPSHAGTNASTVQFISRTATVGEAQIKCEGNEVLINSVQGGSPRACINFENDGGGCNNNTCSINNAAGSYVRAVALTGDSNAASINSTTGNVSTNGATNCAVAGYVGGWINNWSEFSENDFSKLTSNSTRDAKNKSVQLLPITVINDASQGTPDLTTGALNSGTLSYDINHASSIKISFEGDLQGGSAVKNFAITDDDGDLLNASFTAAQTGQFSVECSIFVTATNRYDAISKVTFNGATTHYRTTRTSLTDFEKTFSLDAYVGAGGGVVYRNATIRVNP